MFERSDKLKLFKEIPNYNNVYFLIKKTCSRAQPSEYILNDK